MSLVWTFLDVAQWTGGGVSGGKAVVRVPVLGLRFWVPSTLFPQSLAGVDVGLVHQSEPGFYMGSGSAPTVLPRRSLQAHTLTPVTIRMLLDGAVHSVRLPDVTGRQVIARYLSQNYWKKMTCPRRKGYRAWCASKLQVVTRERFLPYYHFFSLLPCRACGRHTLAPNPSSHSDVTSRCPC